jgi:hypothetical protein
MYAIPPSALELFPEHAKLIGLIIGEAAAVEQGLVTLLALTLRADANVVYPMLYATTSSKGRLDAMRAAFRQLLAGTAALEAIEEILDKADRLLHKRNEYAHAHFAVSEDKALLMLLRLKHVGTDNPVGRPLAISELRDVYGRKREITHGVGFVATVKLLAHMVKDKSAL